MHNWCEHFATSRRRAYVRQPLPCSTTICIANRQFASLSIQLQGEILLCVETPVLAPPIRQLYSFLLAGPNFHNCEAILFLSALTETPGVQLRNVVDVHTHTLISGKTLREYTYVCVCGKTGFYNNLRDLEVRAKLIYFITLTYMVL